jgi:hypothetical protein
MREKNPFAEFERLGEAEVFKRLLDKRFQEERRVYALRWLSERGLARAVAVDQAGRARVAAALEAVRFLRFVVVALTVLSLVLAAVALSHRVIR